MKNIACIVVAILIAAAEILPAQSCIVADTCPAGVQHQCDLTSNDPNLWNENYWFDLQTGFQDVPDAPIDLALTATDTCANGSITISYVLFLDLDGNGTQESALRSDSLPAYNEIQYGNAFNPNYSGGALRAFDERPVGNDQKYGFANETIVNGATTTLRLRWNTAAQPGTYVLPELPYGWHKIIWTITDAQGQERVCEQSFTVQDCNAPTVVCLNGLSANVMPNGQIQLWATDFLQYAEDNYAPGPQIQIAVRKAGAGTGFPEDTLGNPATSVIFTCDELGPNGIELWARDISGNADYCQVVVEVMDVFNTCPALVADMAVCVKSWCNDAVIAGVDYGYGPPDSFSPATGCALYENALPPGGNYDITPSRDVDHLNGVNTLDLIRISRHILGLEPLGSPYAMIAADANKSNSITTFDMVEIKKLIQGIYVELPNNTSWRFVDANYFFPNPLNPFQAQWPDTLSYYVQDSVVYFEWKGIKTGDVDCSAYPGFDQPDADDRSTATVTLPDVVLLPGETIELPVRPSESAEWLGLQMGLRFDPDLLEIEAIVPGNLPDMDESAFARPRSGTLNVVWFNAAPRAVLPGEHLFTLKLKALAPVRLSDAVFLANEKFASEAYTANEAIQKLQLHFAERPEPAAATAIFPPQPNPATAGTTLPLRLAQTGTVTLELTDLSGKRLWFSEITLDQGAQLIEIPAAAFPLAGMYVWRVQAGAATASGKLVRM